MLQLAPPRGRRRWRPRPGVDLDPPPLHASAARVCMSWRGPRARGRAAHRLIAAVGEAGGASAARAEHVEHRGPHPRELRPSRDRSLLFPGFDFYFLHMIAWAYRTWW